MHLITFFITFFGVSLGLIGAVLTATKSRRGRYHGFVMWIVSNGLLITWVLTKPDGLTVENLMVASLYAAYTFTSAWGMWNNRPPNAPAKPTMGISSRMTGTIDADGNLTNVRLESRETVMPSKPWPRGTSAPKWSEPPIPLRDGMEKKAGENPPPKNPKPDNPPPAQKPVRADDDMCGGGCCDCE